MPMFAWSDYTCCCARCTRALGKSAHPCNPSLHGPKGAGSFKVTRKKLLPSGSAHSPEAASFQRRHCIESNGAKATNGAAASPAPNTGCCQINRSTCDRGRQARAGSTLGGWREVICASRWGMVAGRGPRGGGNARRKGQCALRAITVTRIDKFGRAVQELWTHYQNQRVLVFVFWAEKLSAKHMQSKCMQTVNHPLQNPGEHTLQLSYVHRVHGLLSSPSSFNIIITLLVVNYQN